MNWFQLLQLIISLITQAKPIITQIGALQTAINATPGTPEHTAAVTALTAPAAPPA